MSTKKQRAKTFFKHDSNLINITEVTIYFFFWSLKELRLGPFNVFSDILNDHFSRNQELVSE